MSVSDDELLKPDVEVTLSNCDREPIHIPGAIQPHGVLITLTEPDLVVRQVSRNAGTLLGREVGALVGTPLTELMASDSVARVRELAGRRPADDVPATIVEVIGVRGVIVSQLVLHRSQELLVCELEPEEVAGGTDPTVFGRAVSEAKTTLEQASGVDQLSARAAEQVKRITGYDRVMVYRFDGDGHGEVIGEAREASLYPLLGHRYPATDIPKQARALYLRQMIRMIVDVDYAPAPIWPAENPLTGEPVDLGLATLRSVSPIHLQYLRNMGVTGTLAISLTRGGELWGLIACHHYSPHYVPYSVRLACQSIGELLSLQFAREEESDLERERASLRSTKLELLELMRGGPNPATGLRSAGELLLELCGADGVSVIVGGEQIRYGDVPDAGPEAAIAQRIPSGGRLVIDRLSREMPFVSHSTELCGVLALGLAPGTGDHVSWYRHEWVHDLIWGGDPSDSITPDLTSLDLKSLSPRRSFESWRETVVGRSRPWRTAQVEAATELAAGLLGGHDDRDSKV